MAFNQDDTVPERLLAIEHAINLLSRLAIETHHDVFSEHISGLIHRTYQETDHPEVKAHYARLAKLMSIDFPK